MDNQKQLEQIGKEIKKLRKLKGLTQGDISIAAGVRLATISEIEAGKVNFQFDTLLRITTALGCHLEISFRNERKKGG